MCAYVRLIMLSFVFITSPSFSSENNKILLLSIAIDSKTDITSAVGHYAKHIFDVAGVDVSRVWLRWQDQLAFYKRNKRQACGYYFVKSPERERYLTFTILIGRSQGYRVIGRKDDIRLQEAASVKELLDKGLTSSYAAGTAFNKSLSELLDNDNFIAVKTSSERMARDVLKGRHDFTLMAYAFARNIQNWAELSAHLAQYEHLVELNQRPEFHIVCSKNVPDAIIQRLNHAIEATGPFMPK